MNRAALLPHPADPFLFNYWLKYFRTRWGSEVTRLYVYINSPIEAPVMAYIRDLCLNSPNINYQANNTQIEHGEALNRLLDIVTEDYVILVEDDGFIFRSRVVDECFRRLESGEVDILGSPRGSCSTEIWNKARDMWGLDYSAEGDVGPNFWPCFFFTKKQYLLDTDRNFSARAWMQGEIIEPLQHLVQGERACGDTFVNTSLQLRAKGLKIATIPQYHGSINDVTDYERRVNLFDGKAPWVHVGSLSSGTHGILQDDKGRALARRLIDPEKQPQTVLPDYVHTEEERNEWERRVSFWELFYEEPGPRAALPEFAALYRNAIDRVIAQYHLSRSAIDKRKAVYHTIGL